MKFSTFNKKQNWAILFLAIGCLFGSIFYWKLFIKLPGIQKPKDSNEIIFNQEELYAINNFQSVDDAFTAINEGNAAAAWVIGMGYSTGQGGLFLDNYIAKDLFEKSAELGFGPALYTLFEIYTLEENNPFLGMVYLNLTIASGHPELLHIYDQLRHDMLRSNSGKNIVYEIEKIAIHKRKIIETKSNTRKDQNNEYINEDILFDQDFWNNIYYNKIDTKNISNWIQNNENITKRFNALEKQMKKYHEKIEAYQ